MYICMYFSLQIIYHGSLSYTYTNMHIAPTQHFSHISLSYRL